MPTTPFLFRFAKPCTSPGRFIHQTKYQYDPASDVVRRVDLAERPLAILNGDDDDPPKTKKHDIEKGEDAKDRRMWQ